MRSVAQRHHWRRIGEGSYERMYQNDEDRTVNGRVFRQDDGWGWGYNEIRRKAPLGTGEMFVRRDGQSATKKRAQEKVDAMAADRGVL